MDDIKPSLEELRLIRNPLHQESNDLTLMSSNLSRVCLSRQEGLTERTDIRSVENQNMDDDSDSTESSTKEESISGSIYGLENRFRLPGRIFDTETLRDSLKEACKVYMDAMENSVRTLELELNDCKKQLLSKDKEISKLKEELESYKGMIRKSFAHTPEASGSSTSTKKRKEGQACFAKESVEQTSSSSGSYGQVQIPMNVHVQHSQRQPPLPLLTTPATSSGEGLFGIPLGQTLSYNYPIPNARIPNFNGQQYQQAHIQQQPQHQIQLNEPQTCNLVNPQNHPALQFASNVRYRTHTCVHGHFANQQCPTCDI